MVISSSNGATQYTASGSETRIFFTFSITTVDVDYPLSVEATLRVFLFEQSTSTETLLQLSTDYVVNATESYIDLTTPAVAGDVYTLLLSPPFGQVNQYLPGTSFPALAHETSLDNLARMSIALKEVLSRIPHLIESFRGSTPINPVGKGGQSVVVNQAEDGFETTDVAPSVGFFLRRGTDTDTVGRTLEVESSGTATASNTTFLNTTPHTVAQDLSNALDSDVLGLTVTAPNVFRVTPVKGDSIGYTQLTENFHPKAEDTGTGTLTSRLVNSSIQDVGDITYCGSDDGFSIWRSDGGSGTIYYLFYDNGLLVSHGFKLRGGRAFNVDLVSDDVFTGKGDLSVTQDSSGNVQLTVTTSGKTQVDIQGTFAVNNIYFWSGHTSGDTTAYIEGLQVTISNEIMGGASLVRPIIRRYSNQVHETNSVSGVLTLDLALSAAFLVPLTEDITSVVISNPPPTLNSTIFSITFVVPTAAGYTINWGSVFKWEYGIPWQPSVLFDGEFALLDFVYMSSPTGHALGFLAIPTAVFNEDVIAVGDNFATGEVYVFANNRGHIITTRRFTLLNAIFSFMELRRAIYRTLSFNLSTATAASSTITIDPAVASCIEFTHDENVTIAIDSRNMDTSKTYILLLKRTKDNSATARTITFPSSTFLKPLGTDFTVADTANAIDRFALLFTGTSTKWIVFHSYWSVST